MSLKKTCIKLLCNALALSLLTSCFHAPYNNFKPDRRAERITAKAATGGAIAGAVITGTLTGTAAGALIGGVAGAAVGAVKDNQRSIIKELKKNSIQFVEYGDTLTLIVPTDKYYLFNSEKLNDLNHCGLNNIVKLLKHYPNTPIYVAGFTDNVGSHQHKKFLSQAQAETMITFLWANGIKVQRLNAEGYDDQFAVSDNFIIHGSAENRRVEIQWFSRPHPIQPAQVAYVK